MILSLALPVVLLMLLSFAVVRGIERFVPETLAGLIVAGLLSALVLWGLASGLFALLYLWQDTRVSGYLGAGSGLRHMLALGAKASVIWAPVMVLTVSTAPRRWKTATW